MPAGPAARPTRLTTDLDFAADGKQVTYLQLPHSSNVSAYGWIGIPIAQIKAGAGPTVLLMGGNHGDEYEGQIALAKLIRNLEPKAVTGRIIVLPMTNFPAAMAGARTSPIDNGNLNRSFPGDADGSITAMIAHYVDSVLLPMADGIVDLHSGGRTLHYVPSALIAVPPGTKPAPAALAALRAFGAPVGYVTEAGDSRTLLAAAGRRGRIAVGSELGGGGQVTRETVRVGEQGVARMLAHFGVAADRSARPMAASRLMFVGGGDYYLYAPARGWFEPHFDLGEAVAAGQSAGAVHFLDEPMREPLTLHFARDGVVICRRPPVPVERGDCIAHLATDIAMPVA